jgi:hypothetical protein
MFPFHPLMGEKQYQHDVHGYKYFVPTALAFSPALLLAFFICNPAPATLS